jgi:branched-chain amino acid transport system permease protein
MTFLSDLSSLVVAGLASGAAYALLALGIVIIFRATDTINFAIGHIGVLALYISTLAISKVPVVFIFIGSILLGGLIGIVTEKMLIRPLGHRKNFAFIALVVTIGLGFLIHAFTGLVWGHPAIRFPALVSGTIQIGNFAVSLNKLMSAVLALLAMGAVAFFFGRTSLGVAMRANAEDHLGARIVGINSNYVARLSWFIGCALSTLGMFFLTADQSLSGSVADQPLFRAIAAVFLGGLTSMPGAVLGGFLVGILDNVAGAYASPNFRDSVVFGVIILVLFFRPAGVLGALRKERV